MSKMYRVVGMLLLSTFFVTACTTERIVERPVIVTHPVEVTRVVEVTRQIEVTRIVEVTVQVPIVTNNAVETPESGVSATPEIGVSATPETGVSAPPETTPTPTVQPLANAIAAAAQSSSGPLPCWGWAQAAQHIGEVGCVEGTVTGTGESSSVFFVNFSPERSSFYLVSFDWAWEELTGECLRAQGTISEYRGRPQLIINEPGQVQYCGSSDGPPAFER